jgi:hypothetical protein
VTPTQTRINQQLKLYMECNDGRIRLEGKEVRWGGGWGRHISSMDLCYHYIKLSIWSIWSIRSLGWLNWLMQMDCCTVKAEGRRDHLCSMDPLDSWAT